MSSFLELYRAYDHYRANGKSHKQSQLWAISDIESTDKIRGFFIKKTNQKAKNSPGLTGNEVIK